MQSDDALRNALVREVQRRSHVGVYYSSIEKGHIPEDPFNVKKESLVVHLKNENGEKDFLVPYDRRSRNINRSATERSICTYLLEKHPLRADSLDIAWKELLAEIKVPGETRVRIGVSDWEENETYSHAGGLSEMAVPSDSTSLRHPK